MQNLKLELYEKKNSIQRLKLLRSYSQSLKFCFTKEKKRLENVFYWFDFTFHPGNLDFF